MYDLSREILQNKDAEQLALYGVNQNQANTWSQKLEDDPTGNNPALAINPITQYFVRQIIQDNRHNPDGGTKCSKKPTAVDG